MTFNQNGSEPFGSYYQDDTAYAATSVKRPRAPYELLVAGLVISVALIILRIFGPSDWSFDVLVSVLFWIGSIVGFLIPFAIYSEVNLARQLNPDYRSNKQNAKNAVFGFVVFGFLVSLVHMFYLSSLLARLLNVE